MRLSNTKSHFTTNQMKAWFSSVLLLLFIPDGLGVTAAQTGEPSHEPILRIETGMHTGAITRVGIDRAGKFLVTGSPDNTARVWSLPTGNLIRILRVPIGITKEGKLWAVAISPDGNTIAAGGLGSVSFPYQEIYIFDRASGRLLHRLSGFTTPAQHLVFSPDGAQLAAAVGPPEGVFMWRTRDWVEIGRGATYADGSYNSDFDHTARLVTSCADGSIRIYDRNLKLLNKQAAPSGRQPFGVRFSPDGQKIAVGYTDTPKVDVLSAETLALLYSADTSDLRVGSLATVAWSNDGKMLYAGGLLLRDGGNLIRGWSDGGRGPYVDTLATGPTTIFDIETLPSGGIAFVGAEPSWGILDERHRRVLFTGGETIDFRISAMALRTDETASTISFLHKAFEPPAVLRVSDRSLSFDSPTGVNLALPIISSPRVFVTDWFNSFAPRVNSVALRLDPRELSRGLAIAPDGERFLLATNYFIHLFDRNGTELGRLLTPGDTWAVNISANGRFAIAAFSDGTIRWYSLTSGQETLAFFLHADRKLWVLWTPSGYYDASPGAEELIGWHVNNGKDQAADFFAVGQFRSTYYRPDVVSKVLRAGDEQLAVKEANEETGRKQREVSVAQQLPPVVEIISPGDGSEVSATDVTVRFRLRSPSGEPVTGFKALIDGRPAGVRQLTQGIQATSTDDTRELRLTVPEHDSEITVIAENRFTSSAPATVRVRYRAKVTRPETLVVKPKLYILAVGVSHYADSKFNLKLADKDANDFVKAMRAQKDRLYREVVVKLLTNEQATKDEVLDGLDWIRQETTANDVAMVFFAGHGVNDQNNYYYYCPYNVDPSRLLRTGVAFSDIKNTVSAIAGKALFFVDTCHSGNSIGLSTRRGPLDINIVINELSSAENGVVVFSAATGSESSYERDEWNNGAFTKALVEGLGGAAAIGDTGRITYNMLNVYVSERVKELTKGQQHPTMISPQTVPDFPIALK